MNVKPGRGWKYLGNAVHEHTSGIRVHSSGLLRRTDGSTVNGMLWPESRKLDWYVRANGGNHRRGAMAWALNQAVPDES